jgi:chemotaxis protein MotB
MARRRRVIPEDAGEDWLTTYADAITLLMAFFVMLFTLASGGEDSLKAGTAAIANHFGDAEAEGVAKETAAAAVAEVERPTTLDQAVEASGMGDEVTVEQHDRGLTVQLTGSALFAPGAVEVRADAMPRLQGIVSRVAELAVEGYTVEVQGHTDDVPTKTASVRSNWDLSALRAASVAHVLIQAGVPEKRVKVVGYGASSPLYRNRDVDGNAIESNQARNRRVNLVLMHP